MSERLEGVINKIIKNWNEHDYIDDKSIYFLAEHARRAERCKQALEFYANPLSYSKGILPPVVMLDGGRKAEKALGESKGESE